MTLYKRNWDCAVCDGEVTYNEGFIRCKCGIVKHYLNNEELTKNGKPVLKEAV